MKKTICILLSVFLIAIIILPCNAERYVLPAGQKLDYDYEGYLNYVNERRDAGDISARFVYYGQFSILGDFERFHDLPISGAAKFHLIDNSQTNIYLTVFHTTNRDIVLNDTIKGSSSRTDISIDQVEDLSCMVHLKPMVYGETLLVLSVGALTYYYSDFSDMGLTTKLEGIYWEYNGNTFHLMSYQNYPTGQDTLVGRMLNYETAEAALAELIAFMDANVDAEEGALKKARQKAFFHEHMPLLTGGGIAAVIVIPTAIALPIVIVKRKKKKAAMVSGE